MNRQRLLLIGVVLFVLFALAFTLTAAEFQKAPKPSQAEAQPLPKPPAKVESLPDLKIGQYQFPPANDKGLRVQVVNDGKVPSKPCQLELTVRKIGATPVGRTMYAPIPAIQPGNHEWITLDAGGILPKNVSLKDTTFKLIVDAKNGVQESNEDNNETWHNL
jgi:hypothetical protein